MVDVLWQIHTGCSDICQQILSRLTKCEAKVGILRARGDLCSKAKNYNQKCKKSKKEMCRSIDPR